MLWTLNILGSAPTEALDLLNSRLVQLQVREQKTPSLYHSGSEEKKEKMPPITGPQKLMAKKIRWKRIDLCWPTSTESNRML